MHRPHKVDLRDSYFQVFTDVKNQFLEPDYEDYGVASNNNVVYLWLMALNVS